MIFEAESIEQVRKLIEADPYWINNVVRISNYLIRYYNETDAVVVG
jgi:uncharacterized protein YciI